MSDQRAIIGCAHMLIAVWADRLMVFDSLWLRVQVSLLLSVPHMSAPMRVQQALRFNMAAVGHGLPGTGSVAVDLLRNPALAKKEMVRSGIAFGARMGGHAYKFLQL